MLRWMKAALPLVVVTVMACASTSSTNEHGRHGKASRLSESRQPHNHCQHRVPNDVCAQCNPNLVASFKEAGDWCAEHGVPESQCYECHPTLSFEPLPELPADADVTKIVEKGEDLPALEAHAAVGKVTLFDFYADWCAACRDVDRHVYALLKTRKDIAVRKLNVVSWKTPLAKRHLQKVPKLPYVLVYGRDGKPVTGISGLDLAALDKAIAEGSAR